MSEQDKRAAALKELHALSGNTNVMRSHDFLHTHGSTVFNALQPPPPNERIAELERENERLRKACDAYSEAELLRGVEPESSRGEIDELRWALRRIANMLDRDGNGIEMHAKEMQGIAAVALLPKLAPETVACNTCGESKSGGMLCSNPFHLTESETNNGQG